VSQTTTEPEFDPAEEEQSWGAKIEARLQEIEQHLSIGAAADATPEEAAPAAETTPAPEAETTAAPADETAAPAETTEG
jgi:hypothetical protein